MTPLRQPTFAEAEAFTHLVPGLFTDCSDLDAQREYCPPHRRVGTTATARARVKVRAGARVRVKD